MFWMAKKGFWFAYLKDADRARILEETKRRINEQLRGNATALLALAQWIGEWVRDSYKSQLETQDWKEGPKVNNPKWAAIKERIWGQEMPAGEFTGQLYESIIYTIQVK